MGKYRYKALKQNGKKIDEHRYIMEKYLGRKLHRFEVVHHIDGNPRNNNIENLEVKLLSKHTSEHLIGKKLTATRIEKVRIASRKTRTAAKLQIEDISKIRNALKAGFAGSEIAARYSVHPATISKLKKGLTWNWV